jgi:DtxR family Mn-dependent transcriptional regulator
MGAEEPKPAISTVMENYLRAIYEFGERGEKVTLTHLAEAIRVSVATTVGMLKRLSRQGLIRVGDDKEITLTTKGVQVAESVVRRHRLAERMLTQLLGLEWYKAHDEAHHFEHAISPHMEEKLVKALGYPTTSPFGHPIPGYAKDSPPMQSLDRVPEGGEVVVERVPERDSRLLEFLDRSGLRPGTVVRVKEVAPFKGTVSLLLDDREIVLGIKVAADILVSTPARG